MSFRVTAFPSLLALPLSSSSPHFSSTITLTHWWNHHCSLHHHDLCCGIDSIFLSSSKVVLIGGLIMVLIGLIAWQQHQQTIPAMLSDQCGGGQHCPWRSWRGEGWLMPAQWSSIGSHCKEAWGEWKSSLSENPCSPQRKINPQLSLPCRRSSISARPGEIEVT